MGVPLITAHPFSGVEGLRHAFTTRGGGVSQPPFETLNLSWSVGDEDDAVAENLSRLGDTLQVSAEQFYRVRQVHGATVVRVGPTDRPETICGQSADALVTDGPGAFLTVGVADCLPILLVDTRHQAIGAVHAGWRGTLEGVLPATIREMKHAFGTQPDELLVALGPGIHRKAYAISSALITLFAERVGLEADEYDENESEAHLDLTRLNTRLARQQGIRPDRIWTAEECTFADPGRFFSYRREGGRTGRMLGIIGWVP